MLHDSLAHVACTSVPALGQSVATRIVFEAVCPQGVEPKGKSDLLVEVAQQ